MPYERHFLVITLINWISWCNGQDPIKMTILSKTHFTSEDDSVFFQCRMTPEVSDENEYNVESLRTGWTRGDEADNPEPSSPVYVSGGHPHYKVYLQNNGNNNAFGVFACKATKDGKNETIISTTRMRSDADIVPSNGLFTQTVSVGDRNVSISMNITTDDFDTDELRWRNNTYSWNNNNHFSFGADTFSFDKPVELYHAGIYECHRRGDRSAAKHGLNLLIVRACPHTRWGPPNCEGVCDSCYNGGVCDEKTGKCICAPGFKGKNCLIACNGNRYGYDCEQRCTYKKTDPKGKCAGVLFCLVHPFGCRCNTGFNGLPCDEECYENTFGASCLQSCHCESNQCNRYTGRCEGGTTNCDSGWTGEFCQECENGYFGISCDQECHCSSENCNRESGLCQGECLPQWADLFPPYSCQTGLVSATSTTVNAFVQVPVNCTTVIGPGGNFSDVNFVLSRSPDDLVDESIAIIDTHVTEDKVTRQFVVSGLDEDLSLYCQLRSVASTSKRVAVLQVNVSVFVLPKISTSPALVSSSATTITIRWAAWNETRDEGTPPIVSYNLYHSLSNDSDWIGPTTYSANQSQDEYNATVTNLDPDTQYYFSVAALREGYGGEGPKSLPLQAQTIMLCKRPPSPENVVTRILGEKQQLVEVSWTLPSENLRCSSGVTKFTTYYYSSETTTKSQDITDPLATFSVLSNMVEGVSYTIFVTLSTAGGESVGSDKVNHLVPVLPSFANPPLLSRVTCESVTMTWKPWTESRDPGTPPVVHYIPYIKGIEPPTWISGEIVLHSYNQDNYQYTFRDLTMDSMYEFCVTVVREGNGGEGDKVNTVKQNTAYCSAPSLPAYVVGVFVGIPVVLIVITVIPVVICFKRYRGRQSTPHVTKRPSEAKFKNAAFGCCDDHAFIGQDRAQKQQSCSQDPRMRQPYDNVVVDCPDFDGYEVPENTYKLKSPSKRGTITDENPYENPVFK